MKPTTTGKALITAKVENLEDFLRARDGVIPPDKVRCCEVADALAGGGMYPVALPRRLIAQLGLSRCGTRRARTSGGPVTLPVYSAIRLTIQGRDCPCDVLEVPDDWPVLIGQIPLTMLDFVVDPVKQRLIGNPAHGGEWMIELY